MKSIQNQYNDLKEGKMSQANFMRNLRMTMPQYVTNITSFKDSVRILKNKGLLHESYGGFDQEEIVDEMNMEVKPEESNDAEFDAILKQLEDEMAGEIAVKSDVLDEPLEEDEQLNEGKGKELHPNLIHPGELRMGIRVEMEHTDDIDVAKKIALDHIAENPYYYTALKLSGIESPTKPKEKAKKEVKSRKKKEAVELIDKANQMQKVKMPKTVKESLNEADPKDPINTPDEKNVKRAKDLSTTLVNSLKRINSVTELDGLFEIVLNATSLKNIPKAAIIGALRSILDRTPGSSFTSILVDETPPAPTSPTTPSSKVAGNIFGTSKTGGGERGIQEAEMPTEDKIEAELSNALSQMPTTKRILKKVDLPQEVNGTIKAVIDRTNLKNIPDSVIMAAMRKILADQPGPSFTAQYADNANIGKPNPSLGKTLEEKLRSMVREILAKEAPSKKNAASEITAKAVDYIDDYNEGESKEYKKKWLENVFDSYEDKVGRRFDDSVFEDVIDMLKAKGYTMTMKETFDGRDNLTNISDDTK